MSGDLLRKHYWIPFLKEIFVSAMAWRSVAIRAWGRRTGTPASEMTGISGRGMEEIAMEVKGSLIRSLGVLALAPDRPQNRRDITILKRHYEQYLDPPLALAT
jgi:hypothetical protein